MNLTHGDDDYIKSINLTTDGTDIFGSIVTEPHQVPPNKYRRTPLTTDNDAKLSKRSNWDNPLFPKYKQATQPPSIYSKNYTTTSGMST